MTNKILITYATRTGSTEGVAQFIGNTLSGLGETVDVIPMANVADISDYRAVVAGSAIQAGKWLPEAMDFIETHKYELNQRPFAAFLVCMTLAMKKGNNYHDTVADWMAPVRKIVPPVSQGLFKGILDIKKIPSPIDRLKFRISMITGVWAEGDHREWESIKAWATELRFQF